MKFLGLIRANLFREKNPPHPYDWIICCGTVPVWECLPLFDSAFSGGVDIAGADRLVVINRTSIIQPLPLAYGDKIKRIPGRQRDHLRKLVRRRLSGRTEFLSRSSPWTWITGAKFIRNSIFRRPVAELYERPPGRNCRRSHGQTLWLESWRSYSHQRNFSWRRVGVQPGWHLPRHAPGR